uniref:Uncharacterized protein n=1 Tax=Streptomyces sp. NBC_00008 TaxID=2903610 RepID=A0AAU2W1L7_9ACTN
MSTVEEFRTGIRGRQRLFLFSRADTPAPVRRDITAERVLGPPKESRP